MRMIFGIASLLVALAIVGIVVKKQLAPTRALTPVTLDGQTAAQPAASALTAQPTVRQQSQQMQQQVKQAVEASMQQPRPMPEDDK
ncbi:MAG: hypothetical protein EOO28_23935 [Comamonadaceae bacterium]|nr:MAG: hypothetical protein EOO28_23935 [Comamonadaceae bacterium]